MHAMLNIFVLVLISQVCSQAADVAGNQVATSHQPPFHTICSHGTCNSKDEAILLQLQAEQGGPPQGRKKGDGDYKDYKYPTGLYGKDEKASGDYKDYATTRTTSTQMVSMGRTKNRWQQQGLQVPRWFVWERQKGLWRQQGLHVPRWFVWDG